MTMEDVAQQVRLEAIVLLQRGAYDPTRPILPYIYRHCVRRLANRVRDRVSRRDSPCPRCAAGDPCGPDGQVCRLYRRFRDRNRAKSNLLQPLGVEHVSDEGEHSMRLPGSVEDDVATAELVRLVDEKLPVQLRADMLRMRAGVQVPKSRLVMEAVAGILREAGVQLEGLGLRDEGEVGPELMGMQPESIGLARPPSTP
jgi:hypothetical protein